MYKFINGQLQEITAEELLDMEAEHKQIEAEYWDSVSYDEAVNAEIRKQYTESQEFSILRQKEEKPEEYKVYYAYCEECKAYVKSKKGVI
jgi:uncharacterized membrane protein YgaE (UPF0421/DUF939 family)